jgi:hypothetical protein
MATFAFELEKHVWEPQLDSNEALTLHKVLFTMVTLAVLTLIVFPPAATK